MLFVEGLPPVAGNVWLQAVQNQSASITTTQILAYAYDPDGDPLTVSSVQAASTNGGSVAFAGNTVTYTPATNYFGFDSFSYTVSDGNGGTATGNVSVLVLFSSNISSTLMSPKRLPGGKLQLTFVGAPGCPYGVQRATVLTGPWSELGVVTVGSGGSGQLVDTNPPPTGAFYRTVFPP
jgi:hypothetical protein